MALVDARTILLKFSFSKVHHLLHLNMPKIPPETAEERTGRKSVRDMQEAAELVFPLTECVDFSQLPADLQAGGYVPLWCRAQLRLRENAGRYGSARALFVHKNFVTDDRTPLSWSQVIEWLRPLTDDAYWRLRMYANAVRDTEESDLRWGCSINCEHRQPRFDRYGQPITVHDRDHQGCPIGTPHPIRASHALRIIHNRFCLVAIS